MGRAACLNVRAATLQSRLSKKVAYSTTTSALEAAFPHGVASCHTRGVGLLPVTHNYSRLFLQTNGAGLLPLPSYVACPQT